MATTVTDDSYSTNFATDLVVGQDLDFQQQGASASVTVEGWPGSLNVGTPLSFIQQGTRASVAPQGIAGTVDYGFIVGGAVPDRAEVTVTGNAGTVGATLSLTTVRQTPEQIAFDIDASGFSSSVYGLTSYKLSSSSNWISAHPAYYSPALSTLSGIIFDLTPGSTYDVRVQVSDGAQNTTYQTQVATRSLPATAGAATTYTNTASWISAANALDGVGGVVQLQDDSYNVASALFVTASGTASNPIYIRGQSQSGTVINRIIGDRIFVITGDYVVLENMTLDGGYAVDYNSPAYGVVLSVSDFSVLEGFTLRDCVIRGFPRAVQAAGGGEGSPRGYTHNCLIYNNTLTGTLTWSSGTLLSNYGWDNDGLRIAGYGNCIWNNTMQGYGDSITFAHSDDEPSVPIECNYAYRNFIRNSINDTFELDHSERFIGIYDNYCENVDTVVSQSDNTTVTNYGPTYFFRNIFVNIAIQWAKTNANWEGWHWYNNTFVRADNIAGDTAEWNGQGFYSSSGDFFQPRFAYRNNMHVWTQPTAGNYVFRPDWDVGASSFDASHNSFYPADGNIAWIGGPGPFTTVTLAIADTTTHNILYPAGAGLSPTTRYHDQDVTTTINPWTNTLTLGTTAIDEVTGRTTLELAAGNAKNAGVEIPGITDGFTGGSPDIGAVIEGRDAVSYGVLDAPDWAQALLLNTWSVQGEPPNPNMFDVRFAGGGSGYGISGSVNVVNYGASAVALNKGQNGWHIFSGGGHGDGWDNAIYYWDIADRSWTRLFDPSPFVPTLPSGGAAGDGIYDDGSPGVPHGWNNYAWDPNNNRFYLGGRQVDDSGTGLVYAPAWYDLNSSELSGWTCLTVYNPIAEGPNNQPECNLTVYDSTRDSIWMVSGGNGGNTRSAFWNGSSWDTYPTSTASGYHRTAAYCPTLDCIFVLNGATDLIIDCSSPLTVVAVTYGGSGPTFNTNDGFRWSEKLEAFIYLDASNGNVYTLTPTGAIIDTWQWQNLGVNNASYQPNTTAPTPYVFALAEYSDGTVLGLIPPNASGSHNVIRLA